MKRINKEQAELNRRLRKERMLKQREERYIQNKCLKSFSLSDIKNNK